MSFAESWGFGKYPAGFRASVATQPLPVGGYRPMNEAWVREIRDACVETDTPFFYKQAELYGKIVGRPELDGRPWTQIPEIAA